jgi:hypothetical protein
VSDRENPGEGAPAGAAGVSVGGGDQGATSEGETTGPGGDTSPAVTASDPAHPTIDAEAQQVVTDLYNPDGERQDDADVTPEPTAETAAVVDDPTLSPDVAAAAAAEVEAAELGDAATAGLQAPGGEAAPDPK